MDIQFSKEELTQRLISIISGALRISPEKISPELRIVSDLDAESLDILDMRFTIEQELGLNIGEHEFIETIGKGMTAEEFLDKFTVSSLIDFTEERLKTKALV